MYDKLVGLLEDINKIGDSINTLQTNYSNAVNKLSTGKGNLISRVENIRKLGIKNSKSIQEKSFKNIPLPSAEDDEEQNPDR